MYPRNNTHAPANQTNVPISLDCVALQKVFFYFHMQKKPEVEGKKKRKEKRKRKKAKLRGRKKSKHTCDACVNLGASENTRQLLEIKRIYIREIKKNGKKKTRNKGDDGSIRWDPVSRYL